MDETWVHSPIGKLDRKGLPEVCPGAINVLQLRIHFSLAVKRVCHAHTNVLYVPELRHLL